MQYNRGLTSGWNLALIWFHWEDTELSRHEWLPSTLAPCHGPLWPPLRRHGAPLPCRPAVHTASLPQPTTRVCISTSPSPGPHRLRLPRLCSVLTRPFRNGEAEVYGLDILPMSMKYESRLKASSVTLPAASRAEPAITQSHTGGRLQLDAWCGWRRAQQGASPRTAVPPVLGRPWHGQRTGVRLHTLKESCLSTGLFSSVHIFII